MRVHEAGRACRRLLTAGVLVCCFIGVVPVTSQGLLASSTGPNSSSQAAAAKPVEAAATVVASSTSTVTPTETMTPSPTVMPGGGASTPTSTPTSTPGEVPTYHPGDAITITWPYEGQVWESAYWDQPDGALYNELPGPGDRCSSPVSGPEGPFTATCQIPVNATPGYHTILIAEFYNYYAGTIASQTFTIFVAGTPAPTSTPTPTGTPPGPVATYHPGDAITITWPYEGQVWESAYWDQPDGALFNELPGPGDRCSNPVSGPGGPLTATCQIPADATLGYHTILIAEFYNYDAGTIASQTFSVLIVGPTPLPTSTATTGSNTPTATDTPVATPTPTSELPIATPSATPVATATPMSEPPTATPTPEAPSATPVATATPLPPTPTVDVVATPTSVPSPTALPTTPPTPTPTIPVTGLTMSSRPATETPSAATSTAVSPTSTPDASNGAPSPVRATATSTRTTARHSSQGSHSVRHASIHAARTPRVTLSSTKITSGKTIIINVSGLPKGMAPRRRAAAVTLTAYKMLPISVKSTSRSSHRTASVRASSTHGAPLFKATIRSRIDKSGRLVARARLTYRPRKATKAQLVVTLRSASKALTYRTTVTLLPRISPAVPKHHVGKQGQAHALAP